MSSGGVIVLTPTGRDAEVTCGALQGAGIACQAAASMDEVCANLGAGTGALLLAEEALDSGSFERLVAALARQEPWSDLPIVLLAGYEFTDSVDRAARLLAPLRNVMVLERPVRVPVLLTALQVALRARQRQYEVRGHLEQRERDAAERARVLAAEQQARLEAETANRLKDEFLATVSHELRTPVNVILGWAGMLRRDGLDPAQRSRGIEVIHRNALTEARVIDELLDISRIVSGKLRMDVGSVELRPLLDDAIESVRPALDAKRITVSIHGPGNLPPLSGDADRLRQVFFNLLTNAVKFTPEGGRITLTTAVRGGAVEVTVTDSGIGIAGEMLPYVFERFRQADSTTTRSYGGLGLGLAIVRQLVELHGGTVSAFSRGLGTGASFIVRLPVRAAADAGVQHPAQAREPADDTGPLPGLDGVRLLVVDDDADGREMVVELLRGAGGIVSSTASAAQALASVRPGQVDVIIADIAMAGMDGFALIRELRDRLADASPVAIALSAYTRPEDRARALAAGFSAHVGKPVDARQLIRVVRELTAKAA